MAKKASSPAKKSASKATKKAPVKKKGAAKKATTARKQVTPAKGAAPAAGAAPVTTIIAQVDVGWGNAVYLRGEGGGLSWEKGVPMDYSEDGWIWSTNSVSEPITFKFLRNDEEWAEGDDLTVAPGGTSLSSPSFA
jgi:hypothetical protein